MTTHRKLCFCLLTLAFVPSLTLAVMAAHDATSEIKSKIAHLEQSLKDKPITDKDAQPIAAAAEGALKAASATVNAGQLYVALEKLGQAEDLLQGARRMEDKAEVEKGGLAAFQSQWNKVSLRLTAFDREAHAKTWNGSPLAVRALAEAAAGKATPLLEGGQGFATATGPKDGLLYVGEAEGEADFATFCRTLKLAEKGAALPLRSVLPELQSLQAKTNAAFQPPESIDLHSRFIALNSQLKLAQELDASKFYAGALYAYLEATRHYGMLKAPPVDAGQQAVLKQAIATARSQLASSSSDESLPLLFLERAESYSVHPDGSAPTPDEWRGARIIVDQVIPAYHAALKPAASTQEAAGKTIEITLVRWPYT
jgi:hypothetical protein